jgi:GTP-binding protein Era
MKVGYVALIGRPNVGKSTLLNYILGEKIAIISDKPQTTRTSILGIKTTQKGQIIFVDNPGIHKPLHNLNKRMMSFVYSSLETADLVCLLIDATQKFGHGDEFALEILKKTTTPIILLINKVDIVKKEKILLIIDKYRQLMDFKEIIPISALRGANVDVLEEKIYDNLPESEKIFKDDETSIQSQRFLISEIIREKLLSHVSQELPWATATYIDSIEEQEESAPEGMTAEKKRSRQLIRATIFVEKESHRRIIIGRQGRMIKTIGTEARKELEKILGTRVYLDLWVKVKEKWRDKADVLDLIEGQ